MRTRTDPPNLRERHHFKALLADNPNHFGHLRHSDDAPMCHIVENGAYERLVDIGHHGTDDRLVALVQLTQACGYDSGIDGHGSTEFVRFYLSCDQGNSWHDYGVASFQAFNIARIQPHTPLSFAASIALPHALRELRGPIRLRAILSWQLCPPPEQPEWQPVWGAVMDRDIIGASRATPTIDAIDEIDGTAGRPAPAFAPDAGYPLGARRAHAYRDAIVRHHTEVNAEAFTRLLTDAAAPDDAPSEPGPALQLVTVALDPNTPDALVAMARLDSPDELGAWHRPRACYASFWLSGNDCREPRYLGSAAFSAAPDEAADAPLMARLPVDLLPYRRPAAAGAAILELTAELTRMRPLSARPPTPASPPGWQAQARIFLPPAPAAARGKLAIAGGIPLSDIDPDQGTTRPNARFAASGLPADELGRPCPFGGLIRLQGPALAAGFSYCIEVRPSDGGPAKVLKRPIILRRRDGSTWQHHPDPESGRYAYVPFEYNVEQLLGEWPSEGDTCHTVTLWTFQLDGRPTGMDSCRIQVANTAPDYELMLSGTDSTNPDHAEPAIVCTYRARDPWFGSARLELDAAGTREPVTTSNTQTPPRGLDWHLPARSIDPARHQLLMTVRNRVIVDSSVAGHQRIERLPLTMERC